MATRDSADSMLPVSALARPGSRVLLVGTEHYPAAGNLLPHLPAVGNSLKDLAAVLRDQVGIGTENLAGLLIDPPDPLTLNQEVGRVASEARDTLLVFYSGHALTGSRQELYLCTKATDGEIEDLDDNALSYTRLLRKLQRSRLLREFCDG